MRLLRLLTTFVVAMSVSVFAFAEPQELRAFPEGDFSQPVGTSMHVIEMKGGHAACRAATWSEKVVATQPDPASLHVIYSGHERRAKVAADGVSGQSTGMSITLRATPQLENYPAAKAAFIRAAQIWENRIANPISVIIDVDYGPTRFGTPYPSEDVIGSTMSDLRGGVAGSYEYFRGLVAAKANNALETAAYGQLPAGTLPTNLGSTDKAVVTSILLRAIGGLPASAGEGDEDPPNIGFNSGFSFDLDPNNGIDWDKMDFEAVTVHELGHALGFGSSVGWTEINSEVDVMPTIFDFFRFRPGVSMGTFRTAQRPMSSGGDHVFFAGAPALALSTGRPNGEGGDGQQSSHWKDDAFTGVRLGLMDPTIAIGSRGELTQNDLDAFAMMGYDIVSGSSGCTETEPNQTASQASPLALPGSCSGSVNDSDASSYSIQYSSGAVDYIEDVFAVNLPTSAKIDVSMTFTNSSADLDVFLFTVSGSSLNVLGMSAGEAATEQFTTANTLSPGTYYVGVSSFDGSSPYTVTVNTIGAATPTPAAPTNLTATATSSTVIRLNWTDNSTNESEFRVEQKVNGTFVDLGSAAANATSINVTDVTPGTTQTFRIRARNSAGNSNYSNEASATTPGATGPCVANTTTMCLLNNRFRVTINYRNPYSNPPGQTGNFVGKRLNPAVPNPDTALFGFADPTNVEVVFRIVDARPFAPRFDIYYGGMTDVEYWINVTDTQTGRSKQYHNATGTVGGGVDRSTFPAP